MTGDNQHDATTELNEALAASFAAGNFDGMGPFYTEDVRILPPRGKLLEGREAAVGFWRNVANRFDTIAYTTVDLKQLGDAARRETGTYTMGAPDGGEAVQGKYIFVWQLVDGEWQIESGIWNRSGDGAGRQGQGQGQGQGGRGAGQGGRAAAARVAADRVVADRVGQGGQGGGGQGGGGRGGGYRQGASRPSFQTGRAGAGAGGPRGGPGRRCRRGRPRRWRRWRWRRWRPLRRARPASTPRPRIDGGPHGPGPRRYDGRVARSSLITTGVSPCAI